MTLRRVLARNGLADGGYGDAPYGWRAGVNVSSASDDHREIARLRRERLEAFEQKAELLAGDLRRLEADARDEGAICGLIGKQTGVPVDDVAAVLSAFFLVA